MVIKARDSFRIIAQQDNIINYNTHSRKLSSKRLSRSRIKCLRRTFHDSVVDALIVNVCVNDNNMVSGRIGRINRG